MIEELYPDDLSSSAKTSPTGAWISFAGEVPAGVRPMLKQFNDTYPHVSVELRADAGYSRKEKAESIRAVHYTVLGHEKVLDAGSGLKKGTNILEVNVRLDESASDSILDDLKTLAETQLKVATREDILDTFQVVIRDTGYVSNMDLEHRGSLYR